MRTRFVPCAALATASNSARCASSRRSASGCSRISAKYSAPGSGGDKGLAGNEDTLDLHFFAEDDEVCPGADLDPPGVGADHARGNCGGGVERRLERDAEGVQVPNRVDHGQDAAREDAVPVAAYDAVAHLDRDVPEAVGAVPADPGAGDRIGDESQAPAGRLPDHAHRVGGEVDSVEDDLDDHVGTG